VGKSGDGDLVMSLSKITATVTLTPSIRSGVPDSSIGA
jgi:hypothetical protein